MYRDVKLDVSLCEVDRGFKRKYILLKFLSKKKKKNFLLSNLNSGRSWRACKKIWI